MEENKNYEDFLQVTTRSDVATYLGGSLKNLSYNFYVLPKEKQYTKFAIQKKGGGERHICAPASSIKLYQRRLATILSPYYSTKPTVHGYALNKSIKTNAKVHCRRRWIVNIDLKDFFQSMHFGRVRGVFLSNPFAFNDQVATTLTQICCFEGVLPQGAPTSPIISNFICRRLDNELLEFAKRHKLSYSRYADDITFSTNLAAIPAELGTIREDNILTLSKELRDIIENNQFIVNESKIRFAGRNNRQEVTGLIVNEKINVKRTYIRRIRSMLHAWEKFGIANAAKEYFEKYATNNKMPDYPDVVFKRILVGRIAFIKQIKGIDDKVYRNLFGKIKALDPTIRLTLPTLITSPDTCRAVVLCEGKTDGIHLHAALQYFIERGEFVDLNVYFYKYPTEADLSNSYLYKYCESSNLRQQKKRTICLFDCDDSRFVAKCQEEGKLYKYWGNNLYSCILPKPAHRGFDEICIEHFYTDEVLCRESNKHRRIYLSNEFDPITGKHRTEDLIMRKRTDAKSSYPKIIDSGVFKPNGENVALSKNDFANLIATRNAPFHDISFEEFRPIFELLSRIVNAASE
ncbi:MAG: RNA-directed DNA polymerase [Alistipes sp.]|nr:RNA-directed DNA polymerase [Alistipes sp.]